MQECATSGINNKNWDYRYMKKLLALLLCFLASLLLSELPQDDKNAIVISEITNNFFMMNKFFAKIIIFCIFAD